MQNLASKNIMHLRDRGCVRTIRPLFVYATGCRDMAIRVYLGHMEPHFGGRGGRRRSAITPLERAMVVSYRLSIATTALSVTIRTQFAIECLRRSNQ